MLGCQHWSRGSFQITGDVRYCHYVLINGGPDLSTANSQIRSTSIASSPHLSWIAKLPDGTTVCWLRMSQKKIRASLKSITAKHGS